jgi:hypothetical protein
MKRALNLRINNNPTKKTKIECQKPNKLITIRDSGDIEKNIYIQEVCQGPMSFITICVQ